MSSSSQGPGWWVASDGNWYPPEQHPDVRDAVGAAPVATMTEERPGSPGADVAPPPDHLNPTAQPEAPEEEHGFGHHHTMIGHHHTMSGGREALLALTVIVLIAGGGLAYALTAGSKTTITTATPAQAVVMTTAAVRQAGSVHVVTSLRVKGRTAMYVNDVAAHSGREVISFDGARVTALEVGKTAYVKANALALTNLFQGSSTVAQRLAGKWLSFPSSGKGYKQISETLTLTSFLQQVMPIHRVSTSGTSARDGYSVVALRGRLPGGFSGTLYVSATGSALPVQEVSSSGDGVTTATFTHWGEPVRVTAPSGAIPGAGTGLS